MKKKKTVKDWNLQTSVKLFPGYLNQCAQEKIKVEFV